LVNNIISLITEEEVPHLLANEECEENGGRTPSGTQGPKQAGPVAICWNIPHVTRPANVPVPIYLASRLLHALFIIRLKAKVLTKTGAALTSRSSLFPRVNILQFVACSTFVFKAFC